MPRAECEKNLLRWTKGLPYKPTNKNPTKNGKIWEEDNGERFEPIKCPFGEAGDRLWVRETFAEIGCIGWPIDKFEYAYRADFAHNDGEWEGYADMCFKKWKPSIFMPRAASRITLEITDIRCERLSEISEDDAIEEGVEVISGSIDDSPTFRNYLKGGVANGFGYPENSFKSLWESINGPESLQTDPYVWAITFIRL